MKENVNEVTIKMTKEQLAKVNKVLSGYGVKIVSEEEKNGLKVNVEPEEHRYDEPEGPEILMSNSGGYVFLHKSVFEDANMSKADVVNMFANETDIYITDLKKEEIDWEGVEVENWGTVARSFCGDLDIKVSDIFECVNPYGDKVTLYIDDHIINIHYDDNDEEVESNKTSATEFEVTADAEGRATISRKILEAAGLSNEKEWSIFRTENGDTLYISPRNDDILEFDDYVCNKERTLTANGKSAIRIKISNYSYTKHKVIAKDGFIEIHVFDESNYCEETSKDEEKKENDLDAKKKEILSAIKTLTGLDLTDIKIKVIKI